jgi:hypothetical protein
VPLHESMRLVPPSRRGGGESRPTVARHVAHGEAFSLSRSLNTFRTFATFGAATA